MRRFATGVIASLAFCCATTHGAPASAQSGAVAAMERLGITLPATVSENAAVRAPLDELAREACDRQAIASLGAALRKTGYRRQGAVALVKFSDLCKGDPPSLRTAINILLDLSDYAETVRVATELIKLEPLGDNGFFLRAVGHERGGDFKKAIDDYATALELFPNKQTISSIGYTGLARSHEKLGQFCDAALAIEAWVAANPTRNDTANAQAMIAGNVSKGKCASGDKMDDVFPVSRQGNVVMIDVTVNGSKGRFILDTGATWVSMTRSFAGKAKVDIEEDSTMKLHTANGITDGKRGKAKLIQLKTVKASDVPLVVQADAKGTYGPGIDGLLGMSFLSRFNVTIAKDHIRIASRASR